MPAPSPGVGKNHVGGGGREARGPAGVEEKNRRNVLTAAYFSSPILPRDLISFWAGSALPGSRLTQRGCLLWEPESSFPLCVSPSLLLRRCRGIRGKENAVHMNFK